MIKGEYQQWIVNGILEYQSDGFIMEKERRWYPWESKTKESCSLDLEEWRTSQWIYAQDAFKSKLLRISEEVLLWIIRPRCVNQPKF